MVDATRQDRASGQGDEREKMVARCSCTYRLEAEDCAAVVHEVELDVAAPAHQLPLLLLLSEGVILVLLHDRQVGLGHSSGALRRELEDLLRIPATSTDMSRGATGGETASGLRCHVCTVVCNVPQRLNASLSSYTGYSLTHLDT